MPIYEYKCSECGEVFEKFVNILMSSDTYPCIKCGKDSEKIISSSTFILKGGGWANDSYSSKKKG